MKRYATIFSVIIIVACAAMMSGCGGGGKSGQAVRTPTGSAKFTFKIPRAQSRAAGRAAGLIPQNTVSLKISISGDDMAEPIEKTVTDFSDVTVVVIGDIPIGERYFVITAMDGNNNIIASSAEIAEILDQQVSVMHSELGITFVEGSGAFPSSIQLDIGDTLNVKNFLDVQSYALSIPGTDCPPTGLAFSINSQLACTFTQPGTYHLVANGQTLATITVASATQTTSIFKADASSEIGYGRPPLDVNFAGRVASSASGTATFAWDFGDGGTSTDQNPTHKFNVVGDYIVSFTATSGSNTNTDFVNVHIANLPAPKVLSISPASGSAGAATNVTINGTNFQNGATVQIGGTVALNVVVVEDSQITATVPAGMGAGTYDVSVTNPDGQEGSLAGAFTLTGTSGQTYNIADYFPLAAGDQWTYVGGNANTANNNNNAILNTSLIMPSITVNGRTCTPYGRSDQDYNCFSLTADGLFIHKSASFSNFNGSAAQTHVIVFEPPVRVVGSSISLGSSYTGSSTESETSNGVLMPSGTVTMSTDVMAVENVSTLAGYFPNCVKIGFTTHSPSGETETNYLWLSRGTGIVKHINMSSNTNSSCAGDGCLEILKSASVGGQTYPYQISPAIFDGNFWGVEIRRTPTTALSGYSSITLSNGAVTMDEHFGDFTTGNTHESGSDTFTPYSNATFRVASNANAIGVAATNGSMFGLSGGDPTEQEFNFMVRKGSVYSPSMVDGNYFGVMYTIDTTGENRSSFMDAALSGGTMTINGFETSSNGTEVNRAFSNTMHYSLGTDGVVNISDAPDIIKVLAGENGDVIIIATYEAGSRKVGVLMRKTPGLTLQDITGPYIGLSFGWHMNNGVFSNFARGQAFDITATGSIDSVNFTKDGTFSLNQSPITLGTDGRFYFANDPYTYAGVGVNGAAGTGTNLQARGNDITVIMRALPSVGNAITVGRR